MADDNGTAYWWDDLTAMRRSGTDLVATHTGYFVPLCDRGTRVAAGALVGAVTDRYGAVLQRVTSPVGGWVTRLRSGGSVDSGDQLGAVASPDGERAAP